MTTQPNVTERAEAPIAPRPRPFGALHLAWVSLAWMLVALFFVAGALLLAVRYVAMPRVDELRPRIEQMASRALKAPVSIGRIDASWRGFNPHLALSDVRFAGGSDRPDLSLPRVEGTLSWLTAVVFEPRFLGVRIESLDLDVVRLPGIDSSSRVRARSESKRRRRGRGLRILCAGRGRDPRCAHPLQRPRVASTAASADRATDFELAHVNLQLEKRVRLAPHGLQAQPTSAIAGPIDLRARFRHAPFARPSDYTRWSGEMYGAVDYADLAALARTFDAPVKIKHAQGAVRSWVTFDLARITRVIADIA